MYYEICKHCGTRIQFLPDNEMGRYATGKKVRYHIVNLDWSVHTCPRKDSAPVKIYTEEEKREFERKRLGKDV